MEGDIIMSDSAKLRMCYGIISLIIACLLLSAFVCFIWLAVLIDQGFIIFDVFSVIFFLGAIAFSIDNFIEVGKCMESDET
jgi:hypothetical protein